MARTSHNGFSDLPEAIPRAEEEKQMVVASEKQAGGLEGKEAFDREPGSLHFGLFSTPNPQKRRRKPLLWAACAAVVVIVLGVALGVGLGIGLARGSSSQQTKGSNSSTTGGGETSSPSFTSTRGAYNGTGIATWWNDAEDPDELKLYYQSYSGELLGIKYSWPDMSHISTAYEVVATDAKNGTPISAQMVRLFSSDVYAVAYYHVFYIDQKNTLRQKTIDNTTNVWSDGLLNDLNIQVLDSDQVGLRTCWYYGPVMNYDTNYTGNVGGVRVWVATSETTFNQYAWRMDMPHWVYEQNWIGQNGHANPGCHTPWSGQTTYVMFINPSNEVEFWWEDTQPSESTLTHPVNKWTQVSLDFPNVDPFAGLSYEGDLYLKAADSGDISGWNITFAAENSTITPSLLPALSDDPSTVNSTVCAGVIQGLFQYGPTPYEAHLFYQTQGDDITMTSSNYSTSSWSTTSVPLVNE